ncbi:hypothetical protein LP420_01790 [Massilia sp. B-10]|nr:hypothetical protein LP420_01790 [Massilia sp. B-10]
MATLVILVPRPDATLSEIHQTFLSTHKNVRVMADDASIARVHASAGGGLLTSTSMRAMPRSPICTWTSRRARSIWVFPPSPGMKT